LLIDGSFVEVPSLPAPAQKRLGAQQRRAFQLLASCPFGASEVMMFANGFTRQMCVSSALDLQQLYARTPTLAVSTSVASGSLTPVAGRRALEG
jgi:hypothetical protein